MRKKVIVVVGVLVVVLVVVLPFSKGNRRQQEIPTIEAMDTRVPTYTIQSPTETPLPSLTSTPEPTGTATRQPTRTRRPMATPTKRPTPTRRPTATVLPKPTQTKRATSTRPAVPLATRPLATRPPAQQPTPVPVCSCAGDLYNCGDFSTHNRAQACHDYCMGIVGYDIHKLDGNDNDGLACESLP